MTTKRSTTILLASASIAVLAAMSPAHAATDKEVLRRLELLETKLQQLEQRNAGLEQEKKALEDNIQLRGAQLEKLETAVAKATAAPAKSDQPKVTLSSPGNLFALSSADGRTTIALTGRVHLDFGNYAGFKADNAVVGIGNPTTGNLSGGFNARRARIGVAGKVLGDWTYSFIYDGGNTQDTTSKGIENAIIGYTGFKNTVIELGYTDTLFTLDEATGSNNIMFMERATPQVIAAQFGGGDNRAEIGVRHWGERYWLGAYVTGPAIGVSHTLSAQQISAFQRATYQVVQNKESSLHVGAGVMELISAPTTGPGTARSLSLSDQPELRIDPTTFLNTGALGTVANPVTGGVVYNIETAATYGGFYAQSEYFHYQINRAGRTKASFDGGYAQISYTFGGHRNYVANTGTYSSVIPDRPFSLANGTPGAWEVAARISTVDLTDQFTSGIALAAQPNAVNGGRQTNVTFGLNWYINANMRWMLNYIHSRYSKANSTAVAGAALGVPVGAEINAIAARWQVAF